MAFDFPSSPTIGQTYTPSGGPTYTWDGTAWRAASEDDVAGEVRWFARSSAPSGFLKANGAAVSRTTYAALFTAIGTTFGVGDGSTTFNLPDLRGEFVRGWDDGKGTDSGRAFGSAQADEIESHTHTAAAMPDHYHGVQATAAYVSGPAGFNVTGAANSNRASPVRYSEGASAGVPSINAFGGVETRPRNIALLACIRY